MLKPLRSFSPVRGLCNVNRYFLGTLLPVHLPGTLKSLPWSVVSANYHFCPLIVAVGARVLRVQIDCMNWRPLTARGSYRLSFNAYETTAYVYPCFGVLLNRAIWVSLSLTGISDAHGCYLAPWAHLALWQAFFRVSCHCSVPSQTGSIGA